MTNDSPDLELMRTIRARWHDVIVSAVASTVIPEAFLAALIANETGGKPEAKRFEKNVFASLWDVLVARAVRYGSISESQILKYISSGVTPVSGPDIFPSDVFHRLDELATSWGLTQIMGYHILEWADVPGWYRAVDDLSVPESNLKCAVLLLTTFANRFTLDLSKDFEGLLRCWNGGHPTAATFDPNYVPNGLHRMDLYTLAG